MPLTAFGHAMKDIRKAGGIRQKELAYRLGCAHTYVSGKERGDGRPTDAYIQRVAAAMQLTPAQITGLIAAADRDVRALPVDHLTPDDRAFAGAIIRNFRKLSPGLVRQIEMAIK